MKTFLSIISIKTNNFSNEKIVVGLLAVTADKIYYAYSKDKLNVLNKFSKNNNLSVFSKNILNQIKKKITKTNSKGTENQFHLNFSNSLFSEEYFSYLSNYNNGVVNFSKPFEINYDFSNTDFEKYYLNFLGEGITYKEKNNKTSFYKKIKPYFEKQGLKEKADLDYTLNPLDFQGILKDCKIPLITKNGNINAIQTIDFCMQPDTITNHLYETKIIFDALNKFAPKVNTSVEKIKVAFEEPELKTEQYKLFDLAIKEYNDTFEFITPDKVDDFTTKIINSEFTKFSSLV